MPALLARAVRFLQANMQQLSSSQESTHYAWKWISLADKAGQSDVAQACITSCFSKFESAAIMKACTKELVLALSPSTSYHLLMCSFAEAQQKAKPGMAFCGHCRNLRNMHVPGAPAAAGAGPALAAFGARPVQSGIAPVAAFGATAASQPCVSMLRCQVCQKDTSFAVCPREDTASTQAGANTGFGHGFGAGAAAAVAPEQPAYVPAPFGIMLSEGVSYRRPVFRR
jgi:hypothetical protein